MTLLRLLRSHVFVQTTSHQRNPYTVLLNALVIHTSRHLFICWMTILGHMHNQCF